MRTRGVSSTKEARRRARARASAARRRAPPSWSPVDLLALWEPHLEALWERIGESSHTPEERADLADELFREACAVIALATLVDFAAHAEAAQTDTRTTRARRRSIACAARPSSCRITWADG
jgi:hypothetical protein